VYYKKNILLLNTINKTFLEYRYDDRSTSATTESRELGPWLIIKYTENKKYGVFSEEMEDISEIIREYIYISGPDKPLRGISTYKIGELLEIASKIPMLAKIPGSEGVGYRGNSVERSSKELAKESKLSKPDLYGKIWHNLLWG
jgi:hypothetical protein